MCVHADPHQALALPEMLEDALEHGSTNCISFNRKGTLLAGMDQVQYQNQNFLCLFGAAASSSRRKDRKEMLDKLWQSNLWNGTGDWMQKE